MQEEWKPIKDFEDCYMVSNLGNVKNIRRKNGMLKVAPGSRGYVKVTLQKEGKSYYRVVHRLVAEAFLPNEFNKKTVNHINSIRHDNKVSNLEWATHSENMLHAFSKGKKKPIKRNDSDQSKLSTEEVEAVLVFIRRGVGNRELADILRVSPTLISNIRRGACKW